MVTVKVVEGPYNVFTFINKKLIPINIEGDIIHIAKIDDEYLVYPKTAVYVDFNADGQYIMYIQKDFYIAGKTLKTVDDYLIAVCVVKRLSANSFINQGVYLVFFRRLNDSYEPIYLERLNMPAKINAEKIINVPENYVQDKIQELNTAFNQIVQFTDSMKAAKLILKYGATNAVVKAKAAFERAQQLKQKQTKSKQVELEVIEVGTQSSSIEDDLVL